MLAISVANSRKNLPIKLAGISISVDGHSSTYKVLWGGLLVVIPYCHTKQPKGNLIPACNWNLYFVIKD
jgi:hypothetical protein